MIIYRVVTSISYITLHNDFNNPDQAIKFADSLITSAVKTRDGLPDVTIKLITEEQKGEMDEDS